MASTLLLRKGLNSASSWCRMSSRSEKNASWCRTLAIRVNVRWYPLGRRPESCEPCKRGTLISSRK